ncbi:MAG TPA: SulP family inorganic anion transporter [Polyangiales bacterium]
MVPTSLPKNSAGISAGPRWGADLLAGFLVFLIALPLCLGIAMASNFPPISGILTAVIGGVVATFFGSARLTIKGPAAGLIVIGLDAVNELGKGDAFAGYRLALATIVVAALIQILFSAVKAGALGDFFPSSVVHGMLAAIGVIICSKQIHTMLGVTPRNGDPMALLAQVPSSVANMNPEVALIGVLSLGILFGWTYLPWASLRKVPPQLVVVVVSLLLAWIFDLGHEHHYQLQGRDFAVGPSFLVTLPGSLLSAITFPDFSQVFSASSLKFIVMFALVGSLESLLSAKAVDALDPHKRRSDMDKDLRAVGIGNLLAGLLGGLPMISEIVRSSANINSGAKTRWANFFHGLFLLVCVVGVPWLLARIPLAALAAMLIYTGIRLASPKEFAKTWRIGREQMVIFAGTIVVTVATDLLLGVFVGIVIKAILHWSRGMPLRGMFRPELQTEETSDTVYVKVGRAAVFSNYLTIKRHLDTLTVSTKVVIVDLGCTRIVDHTVMEKLHELESDWAREGRTLRVAGLDAHERVSAHPLAARRNKDAGALGPLAH